MEQKLETLLQNIRPTHPEELRYYRLHLPRYEATLGAIKEHVTGKVVADLGAIPGHLARACKLSGARRVIALDYDPERFGFAVSLRERGLEIVKCDLEKEPLPLPDASLDLILFTEVIEHLPTAAQKTLMECRRVLKPGGFLLLTTPNAKNLANRLRRLAGKPVDTKAPDWGERPEQKHHREYARNEIAAMLKNAGFSIRRQNYLAGTELAILRNAFPLKLPRSLAFLYALTAFLIPPWRSYLLFLAEK